MTPLSSFTSVLLKRETVWPGLFDLDYNIYRWFKEKQFQIIEVPRDENHKYYPTNLMLIEPGKVIMAKGATETIPESERQVSR